MKREDAPYSRKWPVWSAGYEFAYESRQWVDGVGFVQIPGVFIRGKSGGELMASFLAQDDVWRANEWAEGEGLIKYYQPDRRKRVVRAFAYCDPNGYIEFADKYGLLGFGHYDGPNAYVSDEFPNFNPAGDEPIAWWMSARNDLCSLVRPWDLAVELQSAKTRAIARPLIEELAEVHGIRLSRQLSSFQPDAWVKRVEVYTIATLNAKLGELAKPYISQGRGHISLYPSNLLGAIYAMFADEVLGYGRPPSPCLSCGSYFRPPTRRRQYCSDRCRVRAHRARGQ
ncbi:MAG: hypothetical protein ACR2HJ_12775 [Fimbriimonadales bacterium]